MYERSDVCDDIAKSSSAALDRRHGISTKMPIVRDRSPNLENRLDVLLRKHFRHFARGRDLPGVHEDQLLAVP